MKRSIIQMQHQRGAVAIMFAVSIFVLFGFMALAIDLGRTYVVRTELQNAADAAALAGAKQLNQKAAGVCCGADSAVTRAIAMAGQNNFKFSSPVTITIANLSVGSCPDDSCMVPASSVNSDVSAAGKTFLKVDIPSGALATFFAVVPTTASGTGTPSTNTYGRAVAGHFVTHVIPIGVCAIDLIQGGVRPSASGDELTEFGFRRGIAYNIPDLNPLAGASGLPIWINPLDAPPGACNPASSATSVMRSFICTGTSTVVTSVPGMVYANTGGSYGPMEKSLNSRFDDYTGGNACDPASAPPDQNIKIYEVPGTGSGNPRDWMDPDPLQQSVSLDPATNKPYVVPPLTISQYGALWSYSRAVRAAGSAPNATAGAPFDLADWSNLYAGNTADTSATGYPAAPSIPPFPAGTLSAPYYTLSGNNYFQAPNPARPGNLNRRVLNIAIIDCSTLIPGPGLACAALPVVGVGKFFMQTPANLTGSPRKIEAEFAGLLNPLPDPIIRLYR